MTGMFRPRRLLTAALTVVCALALAACNQSYPNTTFDPHTEFGRAIDELWDTLLFWGMIVFVLVEIALIVVVVRYRHREGRPAPKHVHGNTTLEILWTVLPAVILVLIAVPTVRTIFATQAEAAGDALQVNVVGRQWWWEFEYPQYGIRTANELYLPNGRTVNFRLTTADVLHSFWVPQLGGKRDLISNRTNYLWFTPDSGMAAAVWNGFCVEYCGDSHANMKFRAFTVPPEEFERWVAHQRRPAVFTVAAPATPATGAVAPPTQGTVADDPPYVFSGTIPDHAVPNTPIPAVARIADGITGDAARGAQLFTRSTCIGCHAVAGTSAAGILGPNLTHVGSRTTIGAGLYPNDAANLAAWIKHSPAMKPGSWMPPQGRGIRDARTGAPGMFDDQQIADLAAYLLALK